MLLTIQRPAIVSSVALAAALVLIPFNAHTSWSVFASTDDGNSSSSQSAAPDAELTVKECVVATEEVKATPRISGILVAREGLRIRLGQVIEKGEVLGVIDDAKAEKELRMRGLEIKVAEATRDVAETEYRESQDVIKRTPGAIPKTLLERQRLTVVRAEHEVQIAKIREEIASLEVDWHRVVAPRSGIIVQIHALTGEWVKKGKPVARIAGLEEVSIEGYLDVDTISPKDLVGKPITFRRDGKGEVQVEGTVSFVSPVIQAGNKRRILANVENRQEDDRWVLQPGMKGEMSIHLRQITISEIVPKSHRE